MTENRQIENTRAQREAADATASRTSRGPVSRAVDAAMARYLAAEQYRQVEPEAEAADESDAPAV